VHSTTAEQYNTAGALATTTYAILSDSGIAAVEKTSLGVYVFHFEPNIYATGDTPKIDGWGLRNVTDNKYRFPMLARVVGSVTTENDVQKVTVHFLDSVGSNLASSTKANWIFCSVRFY